MMAVAILCYGWDVSRAKAMHENAEALKRARAIAAAAKPALRVVDSVGPDPAP